MAAELTKCPKCGKVFGARPGKELCAHCSARQNERFALIQEAIEHYQMRSPEDIASFSGLTLQETVEMLETFTKLARQIDIRPLCSRCHDEFAQPSSQFCLSCRLELNRAFENAADELTQKVKVKAAKARTTKGSPMAAVDAVDMKRLRASYRETRFTPKGRY